MVKNIPIAMIMRERFFLDRKTSGQIQDLNKTVGD